MCVVIYWFDFRSEGGFEDAWGWLFYWGCKGFSCGISAGLFILLIYI